jgi:hypothetical protein
MQECHETQRVVDPEHGAGLVVRLLHSGTRGLNGAACVEALVRFDSTGDLVAVCIEDLFAEPGTSAPSS